MITVYYFSPTGGTKKVAEAFVEGIHQKVEMKSILTFDPPLTKCNENQAVVFVAPVYSGRIPGVVIERMKSIQGNKNPAIIIAVYGNGAYGDAIVELADAVQSQGFVVISAIAALAQHSLSENIARGRPDKQDQQQLKMWGCEVQKLLESDHPYVDIINKIPGNRPYKARKVSDVCTYPTKDCIQCGECAKVCPEHIISLEDFQVIDPKKCITCKACIQACPLHARYFPQEFVENIQHKLSDLENVRKDNEIFM